MRVSMNISCCVLLDLLELGYNVMAMPPLWNLLRGRFRKFKAAVMQINMERKQLFSTLKLCRAHAQ